MVSAKYCAVADIIQGLVHEPADLPESVPQLPCNCAPSPIGRLVAVLREGGGGGGRNLAAPSSRCYDQSLSKKCTWGLGRICAKTSPLGWFDWMIRRAVPETKAGKHS